MLAKPTTVILIFIICGFLSTPILAEPIGSIKHLKINKQNTSQKNIIKGEAPKQTSNPGILSDSNTETPPQIARAQFTTAIVDREPTDNVVMLSNNSSKIYYFSELSNLKGHNVTHRWFYEGKQMAEISFDVGSDRWRVFSSKKIKPGWTGEWKVILLDENGNSLETTRLEVVAANKN